MSAGFAVSLVANVSALAVGVLVYELARREGGDAASARGGRCGSSYLAPTAFVLVMGYAEATLMIATLGRAPRPARAGAGGSRRSRGCWPGLTRPVGLLLVVPGAVRGVAHAAVPRPARELRGVGGRGGRARRSGTGAYLVWARAPHRRPARIRSACSRRRRAAAVGSTRSARCGGRPGWLPTAATSAPGIHVVTAAVLVVLIVVCWRRWPASFTAYAIAVAVVGLSARNLDSLERYSLSTVPLVLAAADLTGGGTRERVVLVALGAVLVACSVLAFSGLLVP